MYFLAIQVAIMSQFLLVYFAYVSKKLRNNDFFSYLQFSLFREEYGFSKEKF